MRLWVRFANFVIIALLGITGFDIAMGLEHWPFGSYPMYSLVYGSQLNWLRLYGVTGGGEIELRGDSDFAPFDQARLIMALQRLQASPDAEQKIHAALVNLLSLYNGRGHRIRALRLYAVCWNLRTDAPEGAAPPDRRMIAEVVGEQ